MPQKDDIMDRIRRMPVGILEEFERNRQKKEEWQPVPLYDSVSDMPPPAERKPSQTPSRGYVIINYGDDDEGGKPARKSSGGPVVIQF